MGRIYEKQTDPPGQKCKYILPGSNENETYRLSTFFKFNSTHQIDPVQLASHGFLYTGYKDRVKCFCCGSNVLDWKTGDDPKSAKWHFEGCELVLGTDSGNVPIGCRQPQFTGRFEKSRLHNGRTRSTSHQNEPQTATISAPTLNTPPENPASEVLSEELNAIQINQNNVHLGDEGSTSSRAQQTDYRKMSSPSTNNSSLVKTCENTLNHLQKRSQIQNRSDVGEVADPSSEERRSLERLFPCLTPINPHMLNAADREATFDHRWPQNKVLATPKEIAAAGFYFLGERDRTKCWYCNGGLQNWSLNDEPFVEHAKWFPGCEFVLRCKGAAFVQKIVRDFPNLKRPALRSPRFDVATNQDNERSSSQIISLPSSNDSTNSSSAGSVLRDFQQCAVATGNEILSRIPNSILDRARGMGFQDTLIQSVAERFFQARRKDFDSFQELLEELLNQSDDSEEHDDSEEQDETRPGEGNQPTDASLKRNNQELCFNEIPGETPLKRTKPSKGKTAVDLRKTLMNLESERKCRVCSEETADCVIMMCGHLVVCYACSANLKRCPLCNSAVSDIIRAYLS